MTRYLLSLIFVGCAVASTGFMKGEELIEQMQFDREKIQGTEGIGNDEQWKSNNKPWSTQEEFLSKLEKIENKGKVTIARVKMLVYSPFEKNTTLSNRVYFSKSNNTMIAWSANVRSHHVAKHNAKPSKEFYDFVMNYKPANKPSFNIK